MLARAKSLAPLDILCAICLMAKAQYGSRDQGNNLHQNISSNTDLIVGASNNGSFSTPAQLHQVTANWWNITAAQSSTCSSTTAQHSSTTNEFICYAAT